MSKPAPHPAEATHCIRADGPAISGSGRTKGVFGILISKKGVNGQGSIQMT